MISYHNIEVYHGNGGFASSGHIRARICRDVFDNQCSDKHTNSHQSGTTSEEIAPTEALGDNPDEKGACNDFDSTKESSEEKITVAFAADQELEVLGPKHGERAASRGVLEDEKHWTYEESKAVCGLPELADGEIVPGSCLGFEAKLGLIEFGNRLFAIITTNPRDRFPGLIGSVLGQEPAS